jgi:hypothetical protein
MRTLFATAGPVARWPAGGRLRRGNPVPNSPPTPILTNRNKTCTHDAFALSERMSGHDRREAPRHA